MAEIVTGDAQPGAGSPVTLEATAEIRQALLNDPALSAVLALLNDDLEETRIVGGAVRNALLGLPVADVDLATTLLPEQVASRVRAAGFKAVPTGIEHGTVTAVISGRPFEITTLRQDIETDGRHAKVRFGRDFAADAMRRDFTINALSLRQDGIITDYVRGLEDIGRRAVRFIGDATKRIGEDHLRILRFFRFSAIYAAGLLDADGLAACNAGQAGIEMLSRERIGQEMRKFIVAPRAGETVAAMEASGILLRALRIVPDVTTFQAIDRIEHEAQLRPDAVRRLAALALRDAAGVETLRDALRLSNEERDRLLALLAAETMIVAGADLRAMLYRCGRPAIVDALSLNLARHPAGPWHLDDIERARLIDIPQNPFRAARFLSLGLAAGPTLGSALKQAEQDWIAAGFPDSPAARDEIAERAAATARDEANRPGRMPNKPL